MYLLMRRLQYFLLPSLMIYLASCNRGTDQQVTYFDSLVVAQTKFLTSAKSSVEKSSVMNGKVDQSRFTPDSVTWTRELEIFQQLSLSQKAAYKPMYHVSDGLQDNRSNLQVRQYLTDQRIPVRELRFYYFRDFRNLKKIEAVYAQENLLYSTTQRLTLEFDEVGGKPVLNNYSVDGSQKMIFSDSIRFAIHSHIVD